MENNKKYGLIGESLGHSFSEAYFQKKFSKNVIAATYTNFELENSALIKELLSYTDCSGFNVTIPYKEKIIQFLEELDPVSSAVGAVNTVKRTASGWKGFNTDVFGFKQMIKPFFKSHHERALILGTGGASKAVAHVLEELGCKVVYLSRNPENEFEFGYTEVNEQMLKSCKIIVNTTPIGTFPNVSEKPAIPYEYITNQHLCIDLIYNPEKTTFLELSEKQGAWVLNGKTMLEQQAEKSWEIWNE